MANYREDIVNIDLECGNLHRSFLKNTIGEGDALANRFGVRVFRNGSPVQLGGTCSGLFIRADGATVPISNGVVNGNVAYVTLTEDCYEIEGVFKLTIKVQYGEEKVTMRIVDGVVSKTSTNVAVDPGTIIPSVEGLIEAIEDAIATIPPDYSETVNALTAKYGINPTYYVEYNKDTHVLSLPGGFYTFEGDSKAVSSQTLDVSSVLDENACNLWIDEDGVFYAGAWNGNAKANCELIGYIYSEQVYINGVPFQQIKVVDNNGNIIPGGFYSQAIIGVNHYDNIVYNYTSKVLTIPPGFVTYKGYGWSRGSATTLDVSSILVDEACILYVRVNGSIYAVSWSGCKAENAKDQVIGYIFRKQVVIFGVNPEQISVIDESTDRVMCFGDSITAGVNTSKLYHMFWHEMNRNLQFHNWGIGSTGYVLEWTGTAVVGGGVIGDGTSQSVSGNNNILKVMQSVSGSLPNICIFGGTNDYGNNIALATFRTAVQNTLDYALTKTSKVFVILPIKRNGWETNTNSLGLHLKDYSDVIAEECEARGIAYADGFNVALDPSIAGVRTAYMPDGLHPNEDGQARIARCLNEKMREAFCR